MNQNKKRLLLATTFVLCSSFSSATNHATHSSMNANEALIHPELIHVAELSMPHPHPVQGGKRLTAEVLSEMLDPQCIYLFR